MIKKHTPFKIGKIISKKYIFCLIMFLFLYPFLPHNKVKPIIKVKTNAQASSLTSPRLLLTPEGVEKIKEKVRTQEWAKGAFEEILKQANCWLDNNSACRSGSPDSICGQIQSGVPREGASSSYYICPASAGNAAGTTLDYQKSSSDSHYCSGNKTCYPGNSPAYNFTPAAKGKIITIEEVWRSNRHLEYADGLRNLAIIYQLCDSLPSGCDQKKKLEYARKTREILLEYAKLYPTLRLHDAQGRWDNDSYITAGKIMPATLQESIWATKAVQAYDLIYQSGVFSSQEKDLIENDLFRALVETIRRNTEYSSNNWQSWHNTAIGSIGFFLNDQDLIDEALNGRVTYNRANAQREIWGFKKQICQLMNEDGFWPEGTSYLYVTMEAYVNLAEAALNSGIDLYNLDVKDACSQSAPKTFKMMFGVIEKMVLPNGYLPIIEDGGGIWRIPSSEFYDIAYSRFGGKFYPWLLRKLKFVDGVDKRSHLFSLLYGQPNLPNEEYSFSSSVLPATGYGVLRAGDKDNPSYALMDFGPHGNHGHLDKLNLIFYQNSQLALLDLGTVTYGSPLYQGYYIQTIGHNTVVVDGISQTKNTGQFIDLKTSADGYFIYVNASADNAYSGINAKRLFVLTKDYLIDSFELKASDNKDHTFDLPFHGYTATRASDPEILTTSLNLENDSLGYNNNGYQYLTDIKKGDFTSSSWAKWQKTEETNNNIALQITFLNTTSKESIFTGKSPFPPIGNTKPIVVWRKQGQQAHFISVIETYKNNQRKISTVSLDDYTVKIIFTDKSEESFNIKTLEGKKSSLPINTPTSIPRSVSPIRLAPGWTKLIWPEISGLTSSKILESINSEKKCQKDTAVFISKRLDQWWQSVSSNFSGQDFTILPGQEYYLYTNKECVFKP